MRVVIDIEDEVLADVMAATGLPTVEAAAEAALQQTARFHRQKIAGEAMAGFGWDGDLDAMREGREF